MPAFRPAPASLPADHRVYAIGDVHGCDDRLAALHAQVVADLRARPIARAVLVHLGDYVDRGPDSAGVVRRLMAGPPAPELEAVHLMGNHERMMLDALEGDRAAATDWLACGGEAALRSWGANGKPRRPAAWAATIPAEAQAFLAALPLTWRMGGYFFVHAGVRPNIPLHAQMTVDLLCIRGTFLDSDRDFGAVVVHGHTPLREGPVVRANRIGIDTGAVFGRALTCAVLEDDRVAFLQA